MRHERQNLLATGTKSHSHCTSVTNVRHEKNTSETGRSYGNTKTQPQLRPPPELDDVVNIITIRTRFNRASQIKVQNI